MSAQDVLQAARSAMQMTKSTAPPAMMAASSTLRAFACPVILAVKPALEVPLPVPLVLLASSLSAMPARPVLLTVLNVLMLIPAQFAERDSSKSREVATAKAAACSVLIATLTTLLNALSVPWVSTSSLPARPALPALSTASDAATPQSAIFVLMAWNPMLMVCASSSVSYLA